MYAHCSLNDNNYLSLNIIIFQCRKKQEDEYKKREDMQHKKEIDGRWKKEPEEGSQGDMPPGDPSQGESEVSVGGEKQSQLSASAAGQQIILRKK